MSVKKIPRGPIWLFGFIVVLFLAEAIVRVKYGGEALNYFDTMMADPILNHKWIPNLTKIDRNRSITYMFYTNSQGWVEKNDISLEKPKDTYRIFYVGDSNVQGVVATEKKMVKLVEKGLNEANKVPGRRFEVINAGVSSYSPVLYYLLIKTVLLAYSPDLIVINVDMTDVVNDWVYRDLTSYDANGLPTSVRTVTEKEKPFYQMAPRGKIQMSDFGYYAWRARAVLKKHSALYYHLDHMLIMSLQKMAQKRRPAAAAPVLNSISDADWLSFEWNDTIRTNVDYSMKLIGETVRMLRAKKVKVMLTGVPHYPQYAGQWSLRPLETLADTSNKLGVPYLDSYRTVKEKATADMSTYYWKEDPTHFNEEGNALWTQAQLKFLLDPKNQLLPK